MAQNPFYGIWQRQFIQFDSGVKETAQWVLWLQAEMDFADVRQWPPRLLQPLGTELLTPEHYRRLSWRQRFDVDLLGFAGTFTWSALDDTQGTCTWHHRLAITPRQRPDTSHYTWLSPHEFLEQGVCEDEVGMPHSFVEHWQRIGTGPLQVWHPAAGTGQGVGLVAADWAVVVEDGRSPQPDLATFHGFAATAWQRRQGHWQPQFGTPQPSLEPDQVLSQWQRAEP